MKALEGGAQTVSLRIKCDKVGACHLHSNIKNAVVVWTKGQNATKLFNFLKKNSVFTVVIWMAPNSLPPSPPVSEQQKEVEV